jgi:chromosomal replication initiator protein
MFTRAWLKNLKKMNPYTIPGINRDRKASVDAQRIIDTICADWGITRDNLFSQVRERRFVVPRHICQFLLFEKCKLNYSKIGRMFERDHTSIIHSRKLVYNFLTAKYDNDIKSYINSKQWL